jgi:hypothetical protein
MEKLLVGALLLFKKWPHHFIDLISDGADADTGDALLQASIFGDLVFG